MRWGIYARNGFEGVEALRQGALAVHQRADILSVSDYSAGQIEDFDVVALFGLQWKGAQVLADYKAAGVPVVVVDYGYLRRTNHAHDWRTGHWQTSLNGLNVLPSCPVDGSRFAALGLSVADAGGDPDGWVLVCPQTTGDATHGLDEEGLQSWVNEQFDRQWPPGAKVLLRPHPLQEHLTYGAPLCPEPTLAGALAGARLVVTLNSNVGHDALLAGVPAMATRPGAAWAPLSSPTLPPRKARLEHFWRLAWGQWTWNEFRTGRPHRFLLSNVLCSTSSSG